jgi:PIN domain nuclease of toxin-antitoxin system
MAAEPRNYILDSFAALAYLQDEAGAAKIQTLIDRALAETAALWMSVVNVAEVLTIVEREKGLPETHRVIAMMEEWPMKVVEADRSRAFAAAHLKARHALSLGDAFAAALAQLKKGAVVTGDPEFRPLAPEIAVEWILP